MFRSLKQSNQDTQENRMPNQTTRTVADRIIRGAMVLLGLSIMFYAATNMSGCRTNGKFTTERKNLAKVKMDGMKSANEYQMALQAFLAGDLDKARRHADSSLALNKEVARTHVLRGRIFMEKNELEGATSSFEEAARLDARNVESYYYRGILAERLLRREEALNFYMQAAELAPNDPQHTLAAAEVMIDLGRLPDAKQFLLSASDRFRHTPGIQQTLGHIAIMENDYAAAETLFTQAQLLAPDQMEIVEDLARVQYVQGNFADAQANLAKVVQDEKFKNRRDLQQLRAKCLLSMERLVEARDVLLTLTSDETGANDIEAWISLGETAYKLRDAARVRMAYTQLISLAPDKADGYILKGLQMRRTSNFSGAEEAFRQAAEIQPTAEVLVLLGLTYERLNEPKLAQRCYSAANQLEPKASHTCTNSCNTLCDDYPYSHAEH
jgi:Flp pilus assembly protein TadD